MIAYALLALGSVGFFVVLAEVIANLYPRLSREITRKIAHVGIAIMISLWPLYIDQMTIIILGCIITIGVLVSMKFGITSSIHGVARRNHGELTFGLAVILAAIFAPSMAVFSMAILFLGLADGFAAVTGTLWGKGTKYKVFGDGKSIVGTATFFAIALAVLYGYHVYIEPLSLLTVAVIALSTTALENIGIRGTDNLLITIAVIVTMSFIS